jgi:hypothetical protein
MNGRPSTGDSQHLNSFESESETVKSFCVLSPAKFNQKEHRQIEIGMA